LPEDQQQETQDYMVESLGWEGRVFSISAAMRTGTQPLCDALMESVADQKRRQMEDEDFRLEEQKRQEQMEYEIRQSIARARALWRERNDKDAAHDDDDDNFDVEVEYVRE
jgi:GTPase